LSEKYAQISVTRDALERARIDANGSAATSALLLAEKRAAARETASAGHALLLLGTALTECLNENAKD
jgi:hypothetical protein